jgi:LEA14-like dessication related protein
MVARRPASFRDIHWSRLICGGSAFILACSIPLTGCSLLARATGNFDDPTIALQTSKVESISLRTTDLLFELVVHNPNGFALRPRTLRYRLSVNHTVVAEGSSATGATVPAGGAVSVELPMKVSRESLSNAAPDAAVIGEIPYDLDVRISFDSWLQAREIHFATSSVLRLNLPLGLADAGATNTGNRRWTQMRADQRLLQMSRSDLRASLRALWTK